MFRQMFHRPTDLESQKVLQGFHLLWQPFLGFSRICLTLLAFILLSFATTRKNSVDLFP